ncbi:MAG: histidine phosphatase family protein [Thermodesulfobacteriota bacterium]|nr:histidine phosphatase family protein [Thermodesulfobacteriota bacterium]
MCKVILIRHGETDWNRQEIFRGRMDMDLNKNGLLQGEAAAGSIKNNPIKAIYSSPLKRAMQTAEKTALLFKIPIHKREGFIDINYGNWEGLAKIEVEKKFPEDYKIWINEPHNITFPEGENLSLVMKRSMKELEEIVNNHQGEEIAVVSHRVVIKVMLCYVLGIDNSNFWRIRQDTCAINIFEKKEGKFIIHNLNDTCHLKELNISQLADF